jgi:hypothetical protein
MTCTPPVRTFRSRALYLAACAFGLVALPHCGASVADGPSNVDAGALDGSPSVNGDADSAPDAQCVTTPSKPVPRPAACSATSFPAFMDAGPAVACTTLADCADAGASVYGDYHACLANECSFDQCLADTDCPTGQACGCADEFGGNAIHYNQCIPTQCRTNGDCGSGWTCSPSSGGYCSSLVGFYCHSAADTCATDADCICPGATQAPYAQCVYTPQLGHFACQVSAVCAG